MTPSEIEKIFRDEAGRALATLIRLVGDFDLAEDSLQDAFAVALERWAAGELPSNPRAWLVNVGRNKAIDRVRRAIAPLFLLCLVINIGMWFERYVIVITSLHRDFLPSSWGMYHPTRWDIATFVGSIGLFV